VPLADADLEGLVVFGAVPDGPPWAAFAEGRVDRWLAGAVRPHLRVRVELGQDGHGPFCWRIPLPSSAPAGAAAWLEGAVNGRLVERLAWAHLVDLSAPMPIDGGTWSARHADRYETEGMGFVVTAVLHDGRTVTQGVDLARPGTDDPSREVPAARTRLRKGLLRALRG
jgi:hypothetical protein